MLNYIWLFMIMAGIAYSIFNGTVSQTANALLEGPKNAVSTIIAIGGLMCFWTGILKIAEKNGVIEIIKKVIKPLFRFLFPKIDVNSETANLIIMNICANFLGMGNAATPYGINAVKSMNKKGSDKVTDDMCMFIILNSCAFTLIPSNILALLKAYSSEDPFSILVPIWIVSILTVSTAIFTSKLIARLRRKKWENT